MSKILMISDALVKKANLKTTIEYLASTGCAVKIFFLNKLHIPHGRLDQKENWDFVCSNIFTQ